MSGFGGSMTVYRQISIDRFDKKNLKSTVFLLSHCHRDHMIGLNWQNFLSCLKSRKDIFLYCSEVTKLLLLSEDEFKSLAPYVRVLEIGVATTVTIPDPESDEFKSVVVTALPAGHCPGSVMFLIEGKEGRALYTGDFRWEKNYATTLPALCVNGHMKEIDSMYVDTTFCVPEAFYIPSRDDCLSATASFVVAWLRDSPRRYVHVSSNTRYGHEPLLSHLAKEANTKVHTSKEKRKIYEQITELRGVFTTDPSARIHACSWQKNHSGESRLPCGYCLPMESNTDEGSKAPEVLVIRPSTMWFTNEPSRLQELVVIPMSGRGLHRVCYSFHSSYSELRDLVSLLRPLRVYPNVLPASDSDWAQVRGRLEKFLTYKHKHHMAHAGDSDSVKPLGLMKRKRKESSDNLTDSEGLVFDSPEKPKLARRESSKNEDVLPSSQKSGASSLISPAKSDAHSSYQGSDLEEDMFDHSDEEDTTSVPPYREGRSSKSQEDGSLRSYVSGDEEVPEEDQVSSLQFRHLTSRDDLPVDDDAQLCLDDEEIKKPPLLDNRNTLCDKQLGPEEASDCDFMCPPSKVAKLCDVKKSNAESKEIIARIFGRQVGKAASRSPEFTNKEERRENVGRHSTTNTDCSVQQKISLNKQTKKSGNDTNVNSTQVNDCNINSETECKPKIDLIKNDDVAKTENKSELQSGVNGNNFKLVASDSEFTDQIEDIDDLSHKNKVESNRNEDSIKSKDVGHHPECDDSNVSDSERVIAEKEEELLSENNNGETDIMLKSHQAKTAKDEKLRQCSTEDGKTALPYSRKEGKKTQQCSEKITETRQCLTRVSKMTQERSEGVEETQQSSTDGDKRQQEADSEAQRCQTDSRADKRQVTNVISSDSDTDVDCQITKSFMKQRVNPFQKFYHHLPEIRPDSCPAHRTCASSMRQSFLQHRDFIDTGTMQKVSVCTCAHSERKQKFSRGQMKGRKSVNFPQEKRSENNSIDLTENDASVETAEKDSLFKSKEKSSDRSKETDSPVKPKEKDETVDSKEKDILVMPIYDYTLFKERMKKSMARKGCCVAEDADIEDNSEEEDSGTRKNEALATSAWNESSHNRKGSPDVVVIEEMATGAVGNCRPDLGAKPLAETGDGVFQNTTGNSGWCTHHNHACSANQRVINHCHSQGHLYSCSPVKCTISAGTACGLPIGSCPAKRKQSALVLCPDPGQSPADSSTSVQNSISPPKKGSRNMKDHSAKRTGLKSVCDRTSRPSSGEKDKDENTVIENKKTVEAEEICSEQKQLSRDSKTEEGKVDEDSDTTLPPNSPDSTVPPDSPVAVHSSESDSDADCKITQSFIRSPHRVHPYAVSQHVHYPHAARHVQHPVAHGSHASHRSGAATCHHHHHSHQYTLGGCQVEQEYISQHEGVTRSQGNERGVSSDSPLLSTQTSKSQQSSVIDLTADD